MSGAAGSECWKKGMPIPAPTDEDMAADVDQAYYTAQFMHEGMDTWIRRAVAAEREAYAAPELLEACKAVLAWREGPEGPEVMFEVGVQMLSSIRAAISKAEGMES